MTATAVAREADATRPVRLLRHVWDRLGAEPGSAQQAAKGREVPGTLIIVGIGMSLRKDPDGAASAVATARAMSRAALAMASRIAFSEQREAKVGA